MIKKSPEQREGDAILRAVIWEELSREFDTASMKPLENPETIDALRLMVRTLIKKNPAAVAERIAGKVTETVKISGDKDNPLSMEIGLRQIDYRSGITTPEDGPGGNHTTPGQDEDPGDGA